VLAALTLREATSFESEAEARRNIVAAIDKVARRLGNTRAVCRRSYVHPAVIDSYLDHSLDTALNGAGTLAADGSPVRSMEAAVLSLLRGRLRSGARR